MQPYLIVVSLRDSLMAEDVELSERVLCAMCKARGGAWRQSSRKRGAFPLLTLLGEGDTALAAVSASSS